jgi:hypothetical protein
MSVHDIHVRRVVQEVGQRLAPLSLTNVDFEEIIFYLDNGVGNKRALFCHG